MRRKLKLLRCSSALPKSFTRRSTLCIWRAQRLFRMLAEARRRGVPITVETCAQYLYFAAEEIPDGATEFKCAPPIRSTANREALWTALESGLIDMVTTDHSPCPPAMKHRDEGRFDLAWGGIASLGLALPVMWTALARRGVDFAASIQRIAEWMGAAPARLAGLGGKKACWLKEPMRTSWSSTPTRSGRFRLSICIFATSFRLTLAPSCVDECSRPGFEVNKYSISAEARIVSPARRAAESWPGHERPRAASH